MNEKTEMLIELANALSKTAGILTKFADLTRAVKSVADEVTETIKAPSYEDVRALLAEKSRDGHTVEVKALITKYGANKLSEVKPELYADLMKEAEVIGSGS